MSLIQLKNISRVFGKGDGKTVALERVDLDIERGEFVAIVGASGSGKSTLMNVIGLLDSPTDGSYKFERKNVAKLNDRQLAKIRRKKIGFVFQSFNLLQRHTALENVTLPMVYARVDRFGREKAAAELLRKVGLEDRVYYYPNELSGGQMQRVAIARALANKPQLILADEPTGNLDSETGKNVMRLLEDLHDDGNTIVVVSHDETVTDYARRIITLKDGSIESDKKVATKNKTKKKSKKSTKTTSSTKTKNKKVTSGKTKKSTSTKSESSKQKKSSTTASAKDTKKKPKKATAKTKVKSSTKKKSPKAKKSTKSIAKKSTTTKTKATEKSSSKSNPKKLDDKSKESKDE